MQNQQMKRLMHGAWTLSLAALIAKILSAVYRVPFQNMVGNTGFYVYQQVYPIYGIGMTFALSGFPVFISKLIAEAREPEAQLEVAHQAQVLLTWLAGGMFVLLEGLAPSIARWMADPALVDLIRTVALMFLTMPVLATARGYFQGTFDMAKTASSQVMEQLVRVAVILLAAWFSLRAHWTPYQMGAVAMSGAFFGGLAAILTIWRPYHQATGGRQHVFPGMTSYRTLLRRFIKEGGSIALFSALLIILQLVDSFTVTKGLMQSGVLPAAAKNLKGIYDRGQPLVQLGLVVATALSATLLPGLTTAYVRHQRQRFAATAQRLLHFSLALSAAATAGLIVLMPAINWLLFGDTAGTGTLQIYVLSIGLVGMINAYNAIMQSLNQYRVTTWALVGGFVVKVVANEWAVRHFGTAGAAITTALSLLIVLGCLYLTVPQQIRQGHDHLFGLKLTAVIVVMCLVVYALGWLMPLQSRPMALINAVVGVAVGVLVFIGAAAAVRLFSVREMLAVPLGRRFMKWLSRARQHKGE